MLFFKISHILTTFSPFSPLPPFSSLSPSLSFFLSLSLSLSIKVHYNGPGLANHPDHGAHLFPPLISSLLKRWREGGREREERNYPLLNFYISLSSSSRLFFSSSLSHSLLSSSSPPFLSRCYQVRTRAKELNRVFKVREREEGERERVVKQKEKRH